jgi:hypothetical protein
MGSLSRAGTKECAILYKIKSENVRKEPDIIRSMREQSTTAEDRLSHLQRMDNSRFQNMRLISCQGS